MNNYRIANTTADFILTRKKDCTNIAQKPHIYFLICENEIVYIGQTRELFTRLTVHYKDPKKIFDSYTSFDITKPPFESKYTLDAIEAYFILKFQPKYNLSVPANDLFLSLPQLKDKYKNLKTKYSNTGSWVKSILKDHSVDIYCFQGTNYINSNQFSNCITSIHQKEIIP